MKRTGKTPLRRAEHRPCQAMRETVCDLTGRIDGLNREDGRLAEREASLSRDLTSLGWTIRQLEVLERIPDNGIFLDEVARRRRARAFWQDLRNAP